MDASCGTTLDRGVNPFHRSASRDACRRPATSVLLRVALIGAAIGGLCGFATGCSSTELAKVEFAASVLYQDATSPAGQKLLADVTSTALNVGLDIAAGNDVGAAVAGIQGAASSVRDYEGLPTAPSSATIAQVAATGAGVSRVAITLAPSVEAIIENAKKSARTQKINVTTDAITEALATGFDQVAAVKGV